MTSYPALRTSAAPEGAAYLQVQQQNYVAQRFLFDVPTWQSFTLRLRARPEFAGESPPVYLQSFGSSENTILVPRDGFPVGGEWQMVNVAYTRVPGATEVLLILRSRAADWWQGVDDLALLLEGLDNGGFEADAPGLPAQAWQYVGGAGIIDDDSIAGVRALSLPPGSVARQEVAHSPYAIHYFLTGRGDGDVQVSELRRGRVDTPDDSATTATLLHLTGGERFLWEPGRSTTGNVATVGFENPGTGETRLDSLSRGWTLAWPEAFEPIENSPIPTVRLAAAWPGRMTAAEIDIVDDAGDVQRTLTELTRDGTSAWIEFDGDGLPAGDYIARFRLTGSDGDEIAPERRFVLRRGEPFPAEPTALNLSGFQSMPWMFFDDGPEDAAVTTAERAEEILRIAKEDGFTLPLIICPPQRLGLFVAAAEAVDTRFVLAAPAGWIPNPASFGNQTFDPEVYRQTLDALYGPYLHDPRLAGIMLVDEVNLYNPLPSYYNRAQVYLERLGYPPGFTFLDGRTPTNGALAPVHTAHWYGYAYGDYTRALEDQQMPAARASGRQFWFGPAAWSQSTRALGAPPEASSIHLGTGLAMGADGYYAFLYTTLNYLGGIRTADFGETRRAPVYRDFNHRVAALAPLLSEFGTARERPAQQNVMARIARDNAGRAHAFIVNQYDQQELSVTVYTDSPGIVEDAETGAVVDISQPLRFAVGQWRLLRFADGIEPTNFVGVPDAIPARRPAGVRTLGSFSIPEGPTRAIAMSNDNRYVSVIAGSTWYLYDLAVGATPALRSSRFLSSPSWTSTAFLDDRTVIQGSNNWGLEMYSIAANASVTRLMDRTRITAAGHDALRINDTDWWSTQSFIGASRLHFEPGDLVGERVAHLLPRHYGFLSLDGPLEDGSVISVDQVHGPYRLSFDGEQINAERLSNSSLWSVGSMSPGARRFAFGRWDRGVAVYTRQPDGSFTEEIIDDIESDAPDQTAWLDDDTLIVDDRRFGLYFYRAVPDGGWTSLGVWESPAGPPNALSVTPGGLIVTGSNDRVVYLLDPSPLMDGHPSGWMLLGE
ncbi:hypothetical protein GC173_04165 [bacterium]|nr:hypothetical protein [bacterium]